MWSAANGLAKAIALLQLFSLREFNGSRTRLPGILDGQVPGYGYLSYWLRGKDLPAKVRWPTDEGSSSVLLHTVPAGTDADAH
ncbi:hypothetical protein AK812_SmicGene39744 [Symbiodinium microadriaticum]|uniref:Uncharacterized protein n=1 Tax=Symbiodinium microadriaticum TaxID=2951 RepID=A0A1Q9CAE8_SYMMI|nr:hypothetical protein AK812_SmicGene39744 [Symbiodinium microadriaticum]